MSDSSFKRVAQLSPVFLPYKGGMGQVCRQNAQGLAANGYYVEVFCPKYSKDKISSRKEKFEGYVIKRLRPLFSSGNAAFIPQLFFYLKKFDIIHIHSPFLGVTFFAILAKIFFKKIKLITTYHMDLMPTAGFKGQIFNLYNQLVLPMLLKYSDKIIFTSLDYAQNSVAAKYLKIYKDKIDILPNAVDIKIFKPKEVDPNILKKNNILSDEKVILFLGGLDTAHYFKGLEYLIKAFNLINNERIDNKFKLVVVGGGDLVGYYQNLIGQLQLTNKVVLAGVEPDLSLEYYNLANVFVLPSINSGEAFGIVLVEAMACGKPVITSNLPGVRSVVDDAVNGFLVPPKDVEKLKEKLDLILNNDELAAKFGSNGLQKVLANYSQEKVNLKLLDIFKNI